MDIAAILTKSAFDLGGVFGGGGDEDSAWTSTSPEVSGPRLKTQTGGPGVTYVQQKPGQTPLEMAQGQKSDPMMQMLMMQMLGGQSQGPSIQLGGQQDPLQQMLMMSMLGKGMGKGAALGGDISSIAGRHSGDYAKSILKQLTPEHYQAAGGSGGEDTIESLISDVIPRELISRHAMQVGGGDVEVGKSILDAHLQQNPMGSGENLQSVLRRMLKANIVETQDKGLREAMGGLGDMSMMQTPKNLSREQLMEIIQQAGSAGEQVAPAATGLAPAEPEPGLSPSIGYPKTGRFAAMRPILKQAFAPLGKIVEMARGGPAISSEAVRTNLPVSQFAHPSGKPFEFDPSSFQNVLMKDPTVGRMARGISPDVLNQFGSALKPGLLGHLGRFFQKQVMGRGTHVQAAEQALRNLSESTGGQDFSRGGIAQHFQTMTGMPSKQVGGHLARNLMAQTAPRTGGQASGLFGVPGLGMEVSDPMQQMIQKLMMIRSMTGGQQQQPNLAGAA